MIAFSCSCGQKFSVKAEFAGRKATCPACKQALVVPAQPATQAFVPQGAIDGAASSLDQADVQADVTLQHRNSELHIGQPSVQELLARRGQTGQRYVVAAEIARGGMGAVLRAVDCDLRREVAVKFMLNDKNPKQKQRFIEEAQITGQLEHPNIVPIHELGIDGQKRLFFSMKMVKGRSLAHVLEDLRQKPREAEKDWSLTKLLNTLVGVCNALAYAHSRGVVHRDLKPANIMLGDFGEVYVMDWGLAKVVAGKAETESQLATVSSTAMKAVPAAIALPASTNSTSGPSSKVMTSRELEADLTQDGVVLGTAAYMPPEQAAGKIGETDQRSDVYSLGAILYEILTLQPPVNKDGGYMVVLMRVCQGEIIAPESRTPDRAKRGKIPKELSAIAMKALAKNPQDRYQDVGALRKDIERFQEGRSVSAKQDTFTETAWKLVKRNKALSAALFVLVPLLIVLLGVAFINYAASKKQEAELVARTRLAVPALVVSARQIANGSKLKEAREQVDLALAYEPKDADAHLLKGQILLGQKDWIAARAELEQYLQQKSDADVRKLLDLCSTGKPDDAATQFAVAEVLGRQNVPGPAIPLLQEVAMERKKRERLLPVYRKQVEVNWKGLGERMSLGADAQFALDLNDCKQVTTLEPLRGMQFNKLILSNCGQVKDLTPLKGMPLTWLDLGNCGQVSDLTPLEGMKLSWLSLHGCGPVRHLAPLRGMPLAYLDLDHCSQVSDLTPLQGMPLTSLSIWRCNRVKDLTPLQEMPLRYLFMRDCSEVHDLTPLQGTTLVSLILSPGYITRGMGVLRQMKSLKSIGITHNAGLPPEEFWKKYDAGEFK